jgi:ubiquitin-like protein Pup
MAQREHARKTGRPTGDEETEHVPVAAKTDAVDADVDAILDEIDDVLEENAEDFVKSFVQKGGQ